MALLGEADCGIASVIEQLPNGPRDVDPQLDGVFPEKSGFLSDAVS
jgi:hypothetical protein